MINIDAPTYCLLLSKSSLSNEVIYISYFLWNIQNGECRQFEQPTLQIKLCIIKSNELSIENTFDFTLGVNLPNTTLRNFIYQIVKTGPSFVCTLRLHRYTVWFQSHNLCRWELFVLKIMNNDLFNTAPVPNQMGKLHYFCTMPILMIFAKTCHPLIFCG